jgi:hypothetical protein
MGGNMTSKSLGEPELEKLADALRRLRGTPAYPPTAKALFAEAKVSVDPRKLASSRKAAEHMRILAKQRQEDSGYYADAPVFLVEDTDDVLGRDAVLLHIVRSARSDTTQACDLAALKLALPAALKASFDAAFERRTKERASSLPRGLGRLTRNGAALLFLLEDVQEMAAPASVAMTPAAAVTPPVTVTPPPAVDLQGPFPEVFGRAFDELNQQAGRRNYVLLHDLRKRLATIPRPDFDQGLNELRRSKKYSLDSADGRHGRLTPEQIDAGIREAGSVLVYVARR